MPPALDEFEYSHIWIWRAADMGGSSNIHTFHPTNGVWCLVLLVTTRSPETMKK